MKKDNKRGFTLIELLVVIAIIGILSSIVLVSLGSAREKARDVKIQGDLASITTALTLVIDDNGGSAAPAHDANTVNAGDCTGVATCLPDKGESAASVLDTYLPGGAPKAPNGNDYLYLNTGTNATFCIQSEALEADSSNRVFCDSGGCRKIATSANACASGTEN